MTLTTASIDSHNVSVPQPQ